MPRPYARLRETTFDLYVERDLLPGYYKVTSVIAAWVVLAGYILFAIVFTSQSDSLNANRNLVTAIASALLLVGYIGILTIALLSKSLLFLIDGVIFPTLTASLIGLFSTIANYVLRTKLSTSQIYMSIPLVTACVTTIVSGVILIIAYRELRKIRRRDERRRWHMQLGPYVGGNGDPTSALGVPGPDDEAQRRQLMRLLHDRRESISAQEETNNTFRIDLPGEFKYDAQPEYGSDGRGCSPSPGGFNLNHLLPWKNNKNGTFKDARERRREEIERSSITNLGEAYRSSPSMNGRAQPPPWGWPPATRYA